MSLRLVKNSIHDAGPDHVLIHIDQIFFFEGIEFATIKAPRFIKRFAISGVSALITDNKLDVFGPAFVALVRIHPFTSPSDNSRVPCPPQSVSTTCLSPAS